MIMNEKFSLTDTKNNQYWMQQTFFYYYIYMTAPSIDQISTEVTFCSKNVSVPITFQIAQIQN